MNERLAMDGGSRSVRGWFRGTPSVGAPELFNLVRVIARKSMSSTGGQMVPAQLEPTKLTSFDSFESNKEIVAKGFDAGLVQRVVAAVRAAEYKRRQAAPLFFLDPAHFRC